jgi:hypothetical protein
MRRLNRPSSRSIALLATLIIVGGAVHAGITSNLHITAAGSRAPNEGTRLVCRAKALSVAMGPQVVPFTGEQAIVIEVANHNHYTCLLVGYPAVVILAGKHRLPFTYNDGGGPYVSVAAPRLLRLHPGEHASFVVAKYRCDVGELAVGTSLGLWLPGVPGRKNLALSGGGVGMFALCRKATAHGPPDPGNTIVISALQSGEYAR